MQRANKIILNTSCSNFVFYALVLDLTLHSTHNCLQVTFRYFLLPRINGFHYGDDEYPIRPESRHSPRSGLFPTRDFLITRPLKSSVKSKILPCSKAGNRSYTDFGLSISRLMTVTFRLLWKASGERASVFTTGSASSVKSSFSSSLLTSSSQSSPSSAPIATSSSS